MMYKYTKMNGNGNSFLVLDNRDLQLDFKAKSKLALRDCNMKSSIGSDGILFVSNSEQVDFKMEIFNSDGSEAEMCGNGARCISKYAYDNKIAQNKMSFETRVGIMKATVNDDTVDLDMGVIDMGTLSLNQSFFIKNRKVIYNYLYVGVPHVVICEEENDISTDEDRLYFGEQISKYYKIFPKGTNVNFVKNENHDTIKVTTYERGVNGITASCGTGSCASAIVCNVSNENNNKIKVINPGGINWVKYEFINNREFCHVLLCGEVVVVADVEMKIV